LVHAAVEGLHGQLTVVQSGVTPCLRCLFPTDQPRRDAFPILGATAGVFGSLQAAEAVKVLTGVGRPLTSRLLVGDLQYNSWEIVDISPAEHCPVCGVRCQGSSGR
jgi:molybdopterin/thiamine biosynthesis adenylyltransferase